MNSRHLLGLPLLSVCLLAGCGPVEMRYRLSASAKQELDATAQAQLADSLDAFFGTPTAPRVDEKIADSVKGVVVSGAAELAAGATSYRVRCMHCHGLSGDGNGPTARYLTPLPRDYRRGIFKFTSTPGQVKPARDDLTRTLRNGIPGTSMPSFAIYDQTEVSHILDYVILLSIRGETERNVVEGYQPGDKLTKEKVAEEADGVAASWTGTEKQLVRPTVARTKPEDKAAYEKSLAHGKELYLGTKAQCAQCHGQKGLGDGLDATAPGVDAEEMKKKTTDIWDKPARPANLTIGVFRGGGRPLDLFRRLHDGIKGTPMPGQKGNLSDQDIWDLVNYVRSLAYLPDEPVVAKTSSGGH